MSRTPDPFLLQAHRVDASRLPDDRAVQVGGDVEQIKRHARDLATEAMVSTPQPYKYAALINWLIVVGCMLTLGVLSVPELRDAAAQVIRQLIGR